MLSITVLGLVITLSAPSVGAFLQNQRISAQAENIASALTIARATALSEAAPVKVCWNPSGSDVVVDTFTIVPGNMAVLVGNPATVIRDFNVGDGLFIDDDESDNCAELTPQGRLDTNSVSGTSLVFAVCSASGETDRSRAIVLAQTGRALNTKNTTQADCT